MMDRDGCIIPLDGLHGLYYTALLRRDTAFDGKFFVCVKTTRVNCRSICPAPKPKRKNCIFVDTTRSAESRGYRACLIPASL